MGVLSVVKDGFFFFIRCLFIYFYFVLAMLYGMWDLSSPTRV